MIDTEMSLSVLRQALLFENEVGGAEIAAFCLPYTT